MISQNVWYWPRRNMILISWCHDFYWDCELWNYVDDIVNVYRSEFVLLGEL